MSQVNLAAGLASLLRIGACVVGMVGTSSNDARRIQVVDVKGTAIFDQDH